MSKIVLCLLPQGFEEIETLAPVDILRRAGVAVTMASLTPAPLVTGRCGITVQADCTLEAVDPAGYDLLLIPGGPGVKLLREDGRAAKLAREFAAAGKGVGAICAAPLVLKDAGLLTGKRYTAHFTTAAELPQALGEERVVIDHNLVTSRGAGTALQFGLALVEQLVGETAAADVAKAIML